MTSKHLFFKTMREDLRHKTWMIALAVLGSFLVLPVAWLIFRDNNGYYYADTISIQRNIEQVAEFFGEYLIILGGIFTVAGALITGLFGFRYVFHKKMVDNYHSLPVKRSTLYGACYLNGLLIWFVPFATALLLTLVMAAGFVLRIGGAGYLPLLLCEAGLTLVVLTVAYLLVYHLILVAVMLSGNILNTLVSMMILGFGAICIYGLGIGFFEMYMDTFYSATFALDKVSYASPLFSACYLLYTRASYLHDSGDSVWQLGSAILINLLIAVALGVGAWFLYQKRASELAEQGIKNKVLIALMKLIVGVAAGMAGWLLLVLITSNSEVWGTFGSILVTVVVFGVMDVIFHMDFKAFFAHKLQMAITTVVAVLACFSFYMDWFGYDAYLPDKDDIAEIAVFDNSFANRYFYGSGVVWYPLQNMHYQDKDVIYTFLERMTGRSESETDIPRDYNSQSVTVRVELENGRSYYRRYLVAEFDKDVYWPIITSEEYLEHTYLLDEEEIEGCFEIVLERNDEYFRGTNITKEQSELIAEGYNKDVRSNPDKVFLGEGRLLTQITLEINNDGDMYSVYLDVYDTMENTVAALREAGYEKWVTDVDASEIKHMELRIGYWPDVETTPEELIALAREYYGVLGEEEIKTEEEAELDLKLHDELKVQTQTVVEVYTEPALYITDRAELEELLGIISYNNPYRGNLFCKGFIRIWVTDIEGNEFGYYIREGSLPEKYILRFGELDLTEFVNE